MNVVICLHAAYGKGCFFVVGQDFGMVYDLA